MISLNVNLKMSPVLSSYLVLGVVFLVVIVLGLIYVIGAIPGVVELNQKRTQGLARVAELEMAERVLGKLTKEDLEIFESRVEAALPSEKKVSGVVSGMSEFAGKSGMAVLSLEFSPGDLSTMSGQKSKENLEEQPGKKLGMGIESIPAQMGVSGKLESLLDLLTRLGKTSQIMGVQSVRYDETSENEPRAQLTILIYYQPKDVSKLDWAKLTEISDEERRAVEELPVEDLFRIPEE